LPNLHGRCGDRGGRGRRLRPSGRIARAAATEPGGPKARQPDARFPADRLAQRDCAIGGVDQPGVGFFLPEIYRTRGACLLAPGGNNKNEAHAAFSTLGRMSRPCSILMGMFNLIRWSSAAGLDLTTKKGREALS